jgi:PAS domain S-box-containing protein
MVDAIIGRNQTEEALRDANQFNVEIVSQAGEGIIVYDRNLRYVAWNQFMESITGTPAADVLGRNALDLFPHLHEQGIDQLLKRALNGETVTSPDIRFYSTSTDQIGWVVGTYAPHRNARGEITGVIATFQDITERKRMEKALRDSENKFATIIEFLPDATFVIDLEGKVVAWNRAMEEMTGVSKDDMIGQGDHAYTVPFYGERRQQLLDLLDKDDKEIASKYQYVQRKGDTLYAEAFAPALHGGKGAYVWATGGPIFDVHGNHAGAIESIRDITERKRSEEELIWNAALLEAQVESSLDGILVVDGQGKRVITNQRLIALWNVPQSIIDQENDEALLEYVAGRVKNPDQFLEKVTYLYRHQYETSRDEIEFKDGLVMDRYSSPVIGRDGKYYGRIWTFRDITERKKAEVDLRKSREKYQNIFENFIMGIYQSIPSGRYLSVNPAFAQLFGYDSPEELMASVTDIGHQLYVNLLDRDRAIKTLLEQGFLEGCELEARRKDGTKFWVSMNTRIAQNENGTHFDGTVEDITERKQAEEALRESEQRLTNIIDFLPDATFAVNREGKVIAWNRAIEEMTGIAKDEILDRGSYAYAVPFYGEPRPLLIDLVIQDQKEIESKYTNILRKGDQLIAEASTPRLNKGKGAYLWGIASPLYDSSSSVVGAIESIRDITERKQVEEALRESRDFLDKIINSIGDPIFVIDRQHRHILVNDALCALANRTREEFIGKTSYDFFPMEQVKVFLQKDEVVFETGEENVNEETITDSQGVTHTVVTKKTLYTDTSGNKSIVGIIRDITDRKKAEEELRQNRDHLEERVRERTAEMERFVYTVSHDLRSPLVTVSGFVGLLKGDLESGDSQRAFSDLVTISEAITKMDCLLVDTLELSRIGRVANPPVDVSFDKIVQEAIRQTEERIKSLDVAVYVAGDMPKVRVDVLRIAEVLINLIENSVKYMGDQERPEIDIGSRKYGEETVFLSRITA